MEPERKEWMSKYAPELEHLCRSHGVALVVVDMRWGITEEATENAQTVNICLREIDRSDIFIGIYAQRYGWHGENDKDLQRNIDNASKHYSWLQSERHQSVTALEYLHGHLNKPGDLPACFAFRSKEYDEAKKKAFIKSKDPKEAAKYVSESNEASIALERVKTRVVGTKDKCLAVIEDYKTPSEGVTKIFEVVKKYIETELLAATNELSQRDLQISNHNAFMSHHSLNYVSDSRNEAMLKSTLSGTNKKLLVGGQSGSGKSSLLSHWISNLQINQSNKAFYIYHFVGCGDDSMVISGVLKRLSLELEHYLDPNQIRGMTMEDLLANKKETEDIKDLMRKFMAKLEELSTKKRVVLVVDAIELVENESKTAKLLYWWPSTFPPNVSVIVSCASENGDVIQELKDRHYDVFELQPFDKKHRMELCMQTLQKHGKGLKDSQIQKIVSCPQSKIPIFLKTLLMELCVFGEFRKLDSKIDSLLKAKSAKELFQQLLIRLEEDFAEDKKQGNMVEKVLCCICLSNQGLSEQEVMTILNIPSHIWSPLYFAIRKFIVEKEGLLQLGVDELEAAVTDRYLKNSKTRTKYLQLLMKYFESLQKAYPNSVNVMHPMTKRPTDELPSLYRLCNDKQGLINTLTNLTTFGRMFLLNEYELLGLWRWVGCSGDEIAQLYIQAIDKKFEEVGKSSEIILSFLDAATYLMEMGHFQSGLHLVLNKRLVFLETNCPKLAAEKKSRILNTVKQKLSIMYTNMGKFKEAEKLQTEVLECRKSFVDSQPQGVTKEVLVDLGTSYHGLAILHTKLGNRDQAMENFNKALNIHKQCGSRLEIADSLHNMGVMLMEKQSFQQALSYCLESLTIYEEEYFGHLPPAIGVMTGNIAVCYRHLGKLDEAAKMYIKAREIAVNALGNLHPNVAHALINHGTHCLNSGNFEEAAKLFKEAWAIHQKCDDSPDNPLVYKIKEKLALALLKLKQTKEAIAVFDEVFKIVMERNLIEDAFVPLYTLIVKELVELKEYQKALEITKVLLPSSKKQEIDFLHLDIISKHIKVEETLLKKFSLEEGLKLWPESFTLLKQLAESHLIPKEEIQKLLHHLDKSYDHISIKDGIYENAMAWCQNAGKREAVIQICEHAVKNCPDNTTFLRHLTQLLHEDEKYEQALPYATRLAEKSAGQPEILLIAGEICARTENFQQAQKYFQTIVDNFSDKTALVEQAHSGLKVVNMLVEK
ncbi:hypothetical protein SNE40_021025 [Patella caerulea]|uniref:Uncharacterized protein n=1 Tax=Patella caerulea TaxID=87958 RepID=A0AAN8GJL7_PATCE